MRVGGEGVRAETMGIGGGRVEEVGGGEREMVGMGEVGVVGCSSALRPLRDVFSPSPRAGRLVNVDLKNAGGCLTLPATSQVEIEPKCRSKTSNHWLTRP